MIIFTTLNTTHLQKVLVIPHKGLSVFDSFVSNLLHGGAGGAGGASNNASQMLLQFSV